MHEYFARRTAEDSDTKKQVIPEEFIFFSTVALRQSKSNISPDVKLSARSSFWLLSMWPSGDRSLPAKRLPKFRKSEQGLPVCTGSEKCSLFRRSYSNYFQKCLLEAKSCPHHSPSAAAGAIVSATRSHTAAKRYRRSPSCCPTIKYL